MKFLRIILILFSTIGISHFAELVISQLSFLLIGRGVATCAGIDIIFCGGSQTFNRRAFSIVLYLILVPIYYFAFSKFLIHHKILLICVSVVAILLAFLGIFVWLIGDTFIG